MKRKDPNYNKMVQKEPMHPMGHGSFANMPDKPIMRDFTKSHDMRSGVVNNYACGIEEESHIEENGVNKGGY